MMNTMRSLRHLIKEGADLNNRESFKNWILKIKTKGVMDKTLNIYIKAYNRYLEWRGEEKIKPYKEMKPFKTARATEEDYKKLMDACHGYTEIRNKPMIDLLFKTGIRYRELINIRLEDIKEDTLIVRGKGQKIREVYLPRSVRDLLKEYLKIRKAKTGNNFLFVNYYGDQLTYAGGHQILNEIAKRAGVHFLPHMARRFYTRKLYQDIYDIEKIRLLLGHEKLDTTKTYLKADQEDAINELRKRDFDFLYLNPEVQNQTTPSSILRPGRDLNPCHELDRLV